LTNSLCLSLSPITEIELKPEREIDWEAIMRENIAFCEGNSNQIQVINKSTFLTSNEIVVGKGYNDLIEYEKNPNQNGISYYDTIHLI